MTNKNTNFVFECFCVECSLCRERVVACCYKSTTAADRLFAFVELTSLVFNLHGVTSLVFNLYGLTSHVLPLCTQFSKLNIAGLRCFSDLSTQWKCGEVSSQIHGEVSQEYQNIDIARFPLAPFIYIEALLTKFLKDNRNNDMSTSVARVYKKTVVSYSWCLPTEDKPSL